MVVSDSFDSFNVIFYTGLTEIRSKDQYTLCLHECMMEYDTRSYYFYVMSRITLDFLSGCSRV